MQYHDVTEPEYILIDNQKNGIIGHHFNYSGDWHHRYFPKCEYADSYRITGKITFGDSVIFINEELVNRNGAGFFLFCHKGITKNQIKLAKRLIRNERDAVYVRAFRYTELDDTAKSKDGTRFYIHHAAQTESEE